MGTFDNAALDSMSKLYRSMLFSPVPVLMTQIFSLVLSYGFYGLFISIGTKREADIFQTVEPESESESEREAEQEPGQKKDSEQE